MSQQQKDFESSAKDFVKDTEIPLDVPECSLCKISSKSSEGSPLSSICYVQDSKIVSYVNRNNRPANDKGKINELYGVIPPSDEPKSDDASVIDELTRPIEFSNNNVSVYTSYHPLYIVFRCNFARSSCLGPHIELWTLHPCRLLSELSYFIGDASRSWSKLWGKELSGLEAWRIPLPNGTVALNATCYGAI